MRNVDILADRLSENFLSLLREKEDFFEFECDSYRMGFEIIAAAMSKALERFDDELFNTRAPGWRVKEKAWREPMGEVGQLFFRRRVYIDDVGDRRCMLDEVLDLPKGMHVTPGAFDKLVGFGVQTSYHATARLFNRHIEGGITAQSAMNALRTSAELLKRESEEKARSLFNEGVAPDAETAESRILLEADGVWVPMQVRGRASMEKAQPRSFEVKAMVAYSGKEGGPGRRRRCDKVVFDAVTRRDRAEAFHLLYGEGVRAAIEFLEGVLSGRANASLRQAIGYLRKFESDIDPHGPSMGTMESTNAHVIGSRMESLGGAWSPAGGNAMARARAHVANGRRLPRPHSPIEVDHKAKWWYVWDEWRYRNFERYQIGESVGEGDQDRVYGWHAESQRDAERIGLALRYKDPLVVPAPFVPSAHITCSASRSHAKRDDLGRNWRF